MKVDASLNDKSHLVSFSILMCASCVSLVVSAKIKHLLEVDFVETVRC